MKILIVEDEQPAAEKLARYIHRYDSGYEVLAVVKSVESAVDWFNLNIEVDLVFMDIQLLDGKSFAIFDQVQVKAPIVFTTAFDEYALEAFKVNSVAYLLKPYTFEDLKGAIDKTKGLQKKGSTNADLNTILAKLTGSEKNYKTRFMVKIGQHIKTIPVQNIRLFFAEGRNAYIVTSEGRKLIIDFNLEQLEDLLDPQYFLRVNRSFILHIDCIKDVIVYSNSRLKVISDQTLDREIIISREKVPIFKSWIDGNS